MTDDRDQDHNHALEVFHSAVRTACQSWVDTRDEPWPGWDNMSPRQLADLGIPELPSPPEIRPQPHLDPLDPGFVLNRWLHPSMYTAVPDPYRPGYAAQVQTKTEAQQAILREARNALNGGREQHDAAGERTIGSLC